MNNPIWPSSDLVTITPSDVTEFNSPIRRIYVGTAGNVSITTEDGTTHVFQSVAASFYIGDAFIRKVNATGTTASNLIGFY
jgi:hypothetical protein